MENEITKIQVLGSGCPTCKKLFENTKQAVGELKFGVEVDYITDITKIVEMGIMQSPVMAINGRPVLVGKVPSAGEIKKIIQDNI